MSDTENLVQICSAYGVRNAHNTITFPDSKLQTLDRRVGAEQLYFGKEWFEKSLDAWEGIPLIYNKSGEHPSNFKAVSENPAKAAKDIGGKIVGAVRNPRIVLEGGARLMATLEISDDEREIYELWQSGKLFPSTAFSVFSDGDKITSAPIPNHVLLFPEIKDKVQPGDFGAYVNTIVVDTSEEKPMAEEIQAENAEQKKSSQSFYDRIVETLKSLFTADGKPKEEVEETHSETVVEQKHEEVAPTDVVESKVETAEKQVDETPIENTRQIEEKPAAAETTETHQENATKEEAAKDEKEEEKPADDGKDAQIEELRKEVEKLKEQIKQSEKEESEKKFTQFLNTFVPEGMKATDAQKSELREKYDKDVVSLMFSIKAEQDKAGSGETTKVGEEYAVANTAVKAYCSVGDLCDPKNK